MKNKFATLTFIQYLDVHENILANQGLQKQKRRASVVVAVETSVYGYSERQRLSWRRTYQKED